MAIGVISLVKVGIGIKRKPQNIPDRSASIRSGKYFSCLSMQHMLVVLRVERENLLKTIHGRMMMV